MRYLILTLLLVFAVTAPGCGGGGLVAGTQQEGTGPDTDQDNLGADLEIAGWEILIDDKGFGPFNAGLTLTSRMVTSDPGMTDTDGDGIDDGQEYQLRTDPRSPDTDGDGLTDFEEWKRWLTSPVSVDTDGDARGPDPDKALAPNPDLFDGRELHFDADGNLLGSSTSPILADTDGDGETDYEEVGHAFRSLVIAEIPQAQIVVDGPIDVFLNVEYEESRGQESSYGTSVSTTKSSSTSSSTSNTLEEHLTLSAEVTVGAEAKTGIDGGVAVYGEVTAGIEGGWMWGSTETTSRESSQELQQENSRLETDRRDKTEIASSGTITAGITVQNTSPSTTVRLESLGIAIRHWQDDGLGGRVFKTLGTLRPPIPGFTLAPGARSPVIQVETSDVAPDVIRRFLAAPDSLHVSPAYFDLVDEEGIDFNFLAENAFAQTAMVEINYGDGRSETYRVATNVDRTDDGELAGIKMREVMTSILGKSWAEMPSDVDICGDRPLVLTEIDGYVGSAGFNDPQMPVRFWRTAMNRQGFRHCGDWGDIVLMPGDVITLSYAVDTDGDGLTDPTEEHFGTTGAVDSDGDTLGDAEETVLGWWAGAPGVSAAEKMVPQDRIVLAGLGYPRRVFSNPRLTDTDQDGLDDAEEKFKGTDPTAPDTDGDGTLDGADPFPLIPGRRLYVDVNVVPTAALPWGGAFTRLQDATAEALVSIAAVDTELPGVTPLIERVDAQRVRSGIPGQPDPNEGTLPPSILQVAADLVTEIWVADGEYVLTAAADTFTLVDCVGIYGGFTGSGFGGREERTRGARNENPISNGTVLQGNDVAEHVVWIDGVGRGAVLDGFVITGGTTKQDFTGPQAGTVSGHGGGIFCRDGSPTLRNLLVTGNDAAFGGGMHAFGGGAAAAEPVVHAERVQPGQRGDQRSPEVLPGGRRPSPLRQQRRDSRLRVHLQRRRRAGRRPRCDGLYAPDRGVRVQRQRESPGGCLPRRRHVLGILQHRAARLYLFREQHDGSRHADGSRRAGLRSLHQPRDVADRGVVRRPQRLPSGRRRLPRRGNAHCDPVRVHRKRGLAGGGHPRPGHRIRPREHEPGCHPVHVRRQPDRRRRIVDPPDVLSGHLAQHDLRQRLPARDADRGTVPRLERRPRPGVRPQPERSDGAHAHVGLHRQQRRRRQPELPVRRPRRSPARPADLPRQPGRSGGLRQRLRPAPPG